jgi:GrpB-like predicted nucleotidyltransferase (UPF0157 family)
MTPYSSRWYPQIAFRDALRADPSLTANYTELKRILAAKYADDREAYTAAKSDFIPTVLERSK